MKKVLLVAILSLILGTAAYTAAPWSLFGSATAVKAGQGPNSWAVSLQSLCPGGPGVCFGDGSFTYSGASYLEPDGNLLLGELYQLSTDYNVTDDDCGGGTPRFQVSLDTDHDGDHDGNIFINIGPIPNFTGCTPNAWQNTGNLIGATDTRYDLTQVGGAFYDTYANALALHAGAAVLGVHLVVDSGWMQIDGEQTIWVDNVLVNNHKLSARGYRP